MLEDRVSINRPGRMYADRMIGATARIQIQIPTSLSVQGSQ